MPETPETLPSQPALAEFALLAGPRRGEELPVRAPVVSIGQGPQNDLVIDDDSVSKIHARLEFLLEGWRLTDLDSTNGTTVEGVRLAPGVPTPLAYGSSVRFGGVKMVFRDVDQADPEAALKSYTPPDAAEPERPRHFRLPLWLFLVILLIVTAVILLATGVIDITAAP